MSKDAAWRKARRLVECNEVACAIHILKRARKIVSIWKDVDAVVVSFFNHVPKRPVVVNGAAGGFKRGWWDTVEVGWRTGERRIVFGEVALKEQREDWREKRRRF